MTTTKEQGAQARVFRLNAVEGLGGKGSQFVTRSNAVSLLAAVIGATAGICTAVVAPRLQFEHWAWEKLTQRGCIPYFIVSCFVFGMVYLVLGWLFRCFPRIGLINIYERDLHDAVTRSSSFPVQLDSLLQQPRLGGIQLLHTRLARLWNSHCRGASAEDLRAQNESLSIGDENSLSITLVPLEIAIWAMPVLGFIGTVWGAGEAMQGLAGAINNVVENGQLNEGTAPFFREAFAGLAVAFDTTLLGLAGLIVVGFGRWSVVKAGTAAVTHVDAIAEDFVALVSYRQSGSWENTPESDTDVPLGLLPDRISRMALDVWRAGHPSKRFLEERVVEGASAHIQNIVAIDASVFPHYLALVEKRPDACVLKLYRLAVGAGDGLFMFMQQLSSKQWEVDAKKLALVAVDSVSETAICPLSNEEMGLISFGHSQRAEPSIQRLAKIEGTIGARMAGYIKSTTLKSVLVALPAKMAIPSQVRQQNEIHLISQSLLGDSSNGGGHRRIAKQDTLLATDPLTSFIATHSRGNRSLRIINCDMPGTDSDLPSKSYRVGGVTCCRFATEARMFVAAFKNKQIHMASYDHTVSGNDAFGELKVIPGDCEAEIQALAVVGSQKHCRIVYLQKNKNLYLCDPKSGKRELVITDCDAVAVTADCKYMLTYDKAGGFRAWGYRPVYT